MRGQEITGQPPITGRLLLP